MLASILTTLAGAFKALASFFGWKSQKDLLNAGRASANADALKQQVEADAQAEKARETVRGDLARNPADVLSDDGFRRD